MACVWAQFLAVARLLATPGLRNPTLRGDECDSCSSRVWEEGVQRARRTEVTRGAGWDPRGPYLAPPCDSAYARDSAWRITSAARALRELEEWESRVIRREAWGW